MEKVNVCIACGSIQITSFNKAGFTFFKCQICGLVRKVDTSSEYIYEKGYYLRKEAKNKYGIQVWNFARYPENIKLISEIMQFVPPPATLVDVGCSYGFFLEEARRFGYEPVGVELSEEAIHYATKNYLMIFRTIDEVIENKIKPRIVTFWHSLEHFTNPLEALQKVFSLLDDRGILLVRVPDAGSVMSKIFDKVWVWFQPEVHIYHFTKESLRKIIERAGFELIKIRSQKPNNLLTYSAEQISVSVLARYLGYKRPLRTYLGRIYEFFTGVELFAIAQKKK